MEAVKRLQLEIAEHRKNIDRLNIYINKEKVFIKETLEKIEEDTKNENEAHNYGLIYEYSNKICTYINQRKELQKLIMMKLEIFTNHQDGEFNKLKK
jgi:hypothetical protein